MAKAYVLEAEVETAVQWMQKAFAAGNIDKGLFNLYLELMVLLGRSLKAADISGPVINKLKDAELSYRLAVILTEADETNSAAYWFTRAFLLDPEKEEYQIGRLRGLLFSRNFAEVKKAAPELLKTIQNQDDAMTAYLMALRLLGEYDQLREEMDFFEFKDVKAYALSRGLMANVYQDLGEWDKAEAAYTEAMHIAGEPGKIAKAMGVYKFREQDFATGFPFYADRFPAQNRKHIPLQNAASENLKSLSRIHLMGEQGIGDQLALLPLLRAAPIDLKNTEIIYVSDHRFDAVLQENMLGINFLSQDRFFNEPRSLQANELVYVGDLSQYLAEVKLTAINGAYLKADESRVAHIRKKYDAMAKGRPIVGVAWNSASLIGHMRSLPLIEILSAVPKESLVINLQYNVNLAEIRMASIARPDLTIINDTEVDQMKDLGGFAAQISALDKVITIDNTTAHFCGALGHSDAHVLIPMGSECMWYWGRKDTVDPWYGNLNLHRQVHLRNWDDPIESVRQFSGDS